MAISKSGNGESMNGERGMGNGEREKTWIKTILLQHQLVTLQICGSTRKLAWDIQGGWQL